MRLTADGLIQESVHQRSRLSRWRDVARRLILANRQRGCRPGGLTGLPSPSAPRLTVSSECHALSLRPNIVAGFGRSRSVCPHSASSDISVWRTAAHAALERFTAAAVESPVVSSHPSGSSDSFTFQRSDRIEAIQPMKFCRRGVAALTVFILMPASSAQSPATGLPALPPDARRVLMAPITESNAVVRARLVQVLQDRRKKSFKAEQKRLDDFVAKLNKGKYAKFRRDKVNVPYIVDWNEPEYRAFRRVSGAVDEWRGIVLEEERYYLDIIEDGRPDTWEFVTRFVEYSVIRARALGYGYQNMMKEAQMLRGLEASDAQPLVKEFAGVELAADDGILVAAQHRQRTINLILETMQQGPPEAHLARFNTWMDASRQAAAARDRQRRKNEEDLAYMLGAFLVTWAAISIAGGGGGSTMPTNSYDCETRHGGKWFENEGLGFCAGYR